MRSTQINQLYHNQLQIKAKLVNRKFPHEYLFPLPPSKCQSEVHVKPWLRNHSFFDMLMKFHFPHIILCLAITTESNLRKNDRFLWLHNYAEEVDLKILEI